MTYYRIDGNFIAQVKENHDEILIKIGNPNVRAGPCVEIEIQKDEQILYLSSIGWVATCNLTSDLKRGSDGTVYMLRSSLAFAYTMFPCKKLYLQDTSGFIDSSSGLNVNLSERDFCLYKATWYQRILKPIVKLEPVKAEQRKVRKYLQILDEYPTQLDVDKLNFNLDKTIFENIQKVKGDNIKILAIVNHYRLFLFGISWKANLSPLKDIRVTFEKVNDKDVQRFAVQWAGNTTITRTSTFHRYIPAVL